MSLKGTLGGRVELSSGNVVSKEFKGFLGFSKGFEVN